MNLANVHKTMLLQYQNINCINYRNTAYLSSQTIQNVSTFSNTVTLKLTYNNKTGGIINTLSVIKTTGRLK
jgi:hypothetical protein